MKVERSQGQNVKMLLFVDVCPDLNLDLPSKLLQVLWIVLVESFRTILPSRPWLLAREITRGSDFTHHAEWLPKETMRRPTRRLHHRATDTWFVPVFFSGGRDSS